MGELFISSNGDFDIQKTHINGLGDYVITSGLTDNGILGKSDVPAKIFEKGTITVDMFGSSFYRQFNYKMVTHARVFSLKSITDISDNQGLFLANSMKYFSKLFGYENMCSWEKVKDKTIKLPIINGAIDYLFMENFVAELETLRIVELETYLSSTGLKDYILTEEEIKALSQYDQGQVEVKGYCFDYIFNNIKQGRRLKKIDQIDGEIPFVMSGTTNNGVVGFISNPVALFPHNSITVDIFGNSFYRDYDFGAGDDTGVYWNDKFEYSKKQMLFFTTAMYKSLLRKFDFGKKLRSSQSKKFLMMLPSKNDNPDLDYIELFISAIIKIIIKDVVLYTDSKSMQHRL